MVRAEFDPTEIHDSIENTLDRGCDRKCHSHMDVGKSRRRAGAKPLRRGRRSDWIGPARWRWWPSPCLARYSSTTGRNWDCRMSNCPTKRCAIRPGNAPGTPSAAATDAAFPIPWRGDTPPFGFSTSVDTWLPIPPEWESLTVEKQLLNADSTLSFFQHALEIRRSRIEFTGDEHRVAGSASRYTCLRPRRRRVALRAQHRQAADTAAGRRADSDQRTTRRR